MESLQAKAGASRKNHFLFGNIVELLKDTQAANYLTLSAGLENSMLVYARKVIAKAYDWNIKAKEMIGIIHKTV